MTRNNADFSSGGSIDAYHVSTKSNRSSIEKSGLIPGEPWNGKKNRIGVFGVIQPKYVDKHAEYADNRPFFDDEGNVNPNEGPHEGGDVWKFTVPAGTAVNDTWTKPRGSAIRYPEAVSAANVERVGHVTGDNQVHWHPEEQCND